MRRCDRATGRHLGSGSNATTNVSAPVPTAYGINTSCTFNSNDACVADARDYNTSVDIVDRAMAFISEAKAADERFYVNIWLHVRYPPTHPPHTSAAVAVSHAPAAAPVASACVTDVLTSYEYCMRPLEKTCAATVTC
jgi:hypothetical protein